MKQSTPTHILLAKGEARRKKVPVADLGRWAPKRRKDDPRKLLAASTRGRVRSLLAIRTERMRASPFGFFRGAAAVMAYDLSLGRDTGLVNQLCGDAHIENLGAYEGADGRLIFDVNDFDETIVGPFEWDVKRMTTSILLAGGQAHMPETECRQAAQTMLDAYCGLLRQLAPLPILEVARFQVHRLGSEAPIVAVLRQAERATPVHSRDHLTESRKGRRLFREHPPLLERVHGKEREEVLAALKPYRTSLEPERVHFFDQYRPIDVAFKVVGTGSVGLRDFCVYLEGNGPDDPIFLQIKEETASAYARYLPRSASSAARRQQGRRAAEGQRAMQLQSDPLLGWTRIGKRDFLVRQLNDHKATLDPTTLDQAGLVAYAHVCGEMLARGHARSGDARVLSGYLGDGEEFSKAMLDFAAAYEQQTIADWKALLAQGKKK